MDFDLDDNGQELRKLTAGLLDREAAPERIETHERSGAPYDGALWKALADAGVLGACLPEDARRCRPRAGRDGRGAARDRRPRRPGPRVRHADVRLDGRAARQRRPPASLPASPPAT